MAGVRALVVGSVNVDLHVRVRELAARGETVTALGASRLPGGKGGNQAVALARLGAQARLHGAVGDDADGTWSLGQLADAGVDTADVSVAPGTPTGLAIVTVDDAGDNAITVVPGANLHVTAPASVDGAGVVVCQLEVPVEAVETTARLARTAGVPVVLNAAPARALPPGLLAQVDVLVVNQLELTALAGTGDPAERARHLCAAGPRAVVVTLGADGCLVVTAEATTAIPSRQVSVVDTTGAGDCFVGALAYGLADGWTLPDAAYFACTAAALSVTRLGARGGLPTYDEVSRAGGRAASPAGPAR